MSYVKQPSGEIQVIASLKEHRVPLPHSVQPDRQFPKCTTGFTLHNEGVSITSTKMGKGHFHGNGITTILVVMIFLDFRGQAIV